ncbi:MAG TPA: DUF1127 domain-containing protein [Acetobacteraceae bacterium]|nr:DUF1127 domain-containing protein [Acetobacteraceae bacterium]
MNQLVIARRTPSSSRPLGVALAAFRSLGEQVAAWRKRQRERAEMFALDEASLKDLGISRAQANFERGKPFWRG